MNTRFQQYFLTTLLAFCVGSLGAQDSPKTAAPALLLVPDVFTPVRSGVWRESLNAAALGESAERGELGEQGVMRFVGGYEAGRFRAPQTATAILGGGFDARGLKRLGGASSTTASSAWTLAGQFRYDRSAHDSVRLSTLANPLNGNPYILADTTGGNWLRDDIRLETSLSTPLLWENVRFGTQLWYGVGQGARRNDPRPLFRYRTLGIAPAVLWQIAAEHSLGGVLRVESRREDAELGFFANDNSFVWRMRGLASYDRIPLVSSQRVTQGVKWMGGVQYAWNEAQTNEAQTASSHRRVVIAVEAYSRTDSVRDGVAEPQFAGMYTEQGVNATASAGQMGELFGAEGLQELRIHAASALGRGIDPIFRAANTSDIQTSAQMQARFRIGKTHQVSPLDAALYLAFEDVVRRDVAADFRSHATNLRFGVAAQGSSLLDSEVVLEWRSALHYRTPLATSLQTGAPSNARGLETALAVPDFIVRSAQILGAEAECAVVWNTRPSSGSLWLRAGIGASFTSSNHVFYNQRAAVRCFFAIVL